jgi:hypothetical protein
MKIAVYTSCALNYYAKACALLESIRRNSPNTSVTLCLCDEPAADCDPLAQGFDRLWQPPDLGYDRAWVFQHNVMELCTGVKGRALERLMQEEPDAALYVYLDPDVYVYNDLEAVDGYLGDASIGLVPHILAVETSDIGVQMTEMSVTEHGIYNLGHLFVRPDGNGRALAKWWGDRLDKYCFDDKTIGLFTDQRWMDLVPAAFEGVRILRVPNLDVASWNISGRDIIQKEAGNESSFLVDGWPLLTYHFSGTGPTGTHRRVRQIFAPSNGTVAEIERHYENAIARFGQQRLEAVPPVYDYFDNGEKVPAEARKLYRVSPNLQAAFPDPYRTGSGETFIEWLREHRPGLLQGFRVPEHRLERAFNALFDADYYLARYQDAREAMAEGRYASALDHYIHVGSALLHDPCEFFASRYYLEQARYLDGFHLRRLPRSKCSTLLWHYLIVGLPHGKEPIEFFDSQYYLASYPDIEKAVRVGTITTPLAHFLEFGASENRRPGPGLDPLKLLDKDPVMREKLKDDPRHGVFGILLAEGRILGREVAKS